MTATSDHGTGKSVLGAWIGELILSTRPDSIGTVTAGTYIQLETLLLITRSCRLACPCLNDTPLPSLEKIGRS